MIYKPTIEDQFKIFHLMNPWVYDLLVNQARYLRFRGHQRVGIGMLFEVLRWKQMMTTDDPHSEFKLNNNYRSHYARLIMANEPDLVGIFELRELRTK